MMMRGRPQAQRDQRLLVVAFSVIAVLACAVSYSLHPALPFNPVRLPYEHTLDARYWSPQGWKFFTRNPREDWLLVYSKHGNGTWVSASPGPNFTLSNGLGIGRGVRAQGIEIALLIYDLPKTAFKKCMISPASCLAQAPLAATLKNRTPEPTLCGSVGVVMQTQLPWAWASRPAAVTMPSRVVRLEVRC